MPNEKKQHPKILGYTVCELLLILQWSLLVRPSLNAKGYV